ncbi:MAG: LysM peptidoglycan-binding domain-containing protein [Candidatus Omnitrophota bacterium]
MKRCNLLLLIVLVSIFAITGCTVRTYPVVKDRVDQDLSSGAGNRGYLLGQPPAGEEKDRKTTRTLRVFEIELGAPVKIEKRARPLYEESSAIDGSGGEIFQDTLGSVSSGLESEEYFENYTVQKGDTLQKISQKYFGTTRKWKKIFDANTDKLKAPDKIRVGQVIRIPMEKLEEPGENLK